MITTIQAAELHTIRYAGGDVGIYAEGSKGGDVAIVRGTCDGEAAARAELFAAASELQYELDQCRQLLERINSAFYGAGTGKALRPVMAETKPALERIRGVLSKSAGR